MTREEAAALHNVASRFQRSLFVDPGCQIGLIVLFRHLYGYVQTVFFNDSEHKWSSGGWLAHKSAIQGSSSFVLSEMKLHQLISPKGGESVCLAGIVTKFDLKHAVLPFLNHCSNFPTPQPLRVKILGQRHNIKQFDFVHS